MIIATPLCGAGRVVIWWRHVAAQTLPNIPIILLPGLNGDPRVFAAQVGAIPSASVARWLPPARHEPLVEYAARVARAIDPGGPCVIGGVSFGGIVALEASRHLRDARACVVIASSRDVHGLPTPVRLLRPLASWIAPVALQTAVGAGWASAQTLSPHKRRRGGPVCAEQVAFRRWALAALLTWKPSGLPPCPVRQIHGERDATFPASRARADEFVSHAGHLLTVTHADRVTAFLRLAAARGT